MASNIRTKTKVGFALSSARTQQVFAPSDLERLAAVCAVDDLPPIENFSDVEARSRLSEIEVLITGWGSPPVDAAVLRYARKLRLIAHAAGSIRGLISNAVFKAGIAVTNAADANAIPVAEYALAMILLANKGILETREMYRQRRDAWWTDSPIGESAGNYGKVVGIIGASRVGRRLLTLLAPFDLKLLVYDPFADNQEIAFRGARLTPLEELLRSADVVTVHAPLLPSSRHMIDRRRLALMREGAVLINTARGALIDQDALVDELLSGRISAILDVTDPEVLAPDSPLFELPNVFLTPHIAGSVGTERQRLGATVVDEVERFVKCEPLRFALDATNLEHQA